MRKHTTGRLMLLNAAEGGRTNVERHGTLAVKRRTAAERGMRFEKRYRFAFLRKQGCCRQSGIASS
jgi:hypothetical protein